MWQVGGREEERKRRKGLKCGGMRRGNNKRKGINRRRRGKDFSIVV